MTNMYRAIFSQPERVQEVLNRQKDAIARAAHAISECRGVVLCGLGTSFHAASIGEYFLRDCKPWLSCTRAMLSFELSNYSRSLGEKVCVIVISYRGNKQASLQALRTAKREGALTIGITGDESPSGDQFDPDISIRTILPEPRAPHTVSYTAAVAVLLALSAEVLRTSGHPEAAQRRLWLDKLPVLLNKALTDHREPMKELAHRSLQVTNRILLGGGPNAFTAHEGALKMKEANYAPCESFHVEQYFHGPMTASDSTMLLWTVAPTGPSYARCADALRAARSIGLTTVASINDDDCGPIAAEADFLIRMPAAPEYVSPLLHIVPLQLFAHETSTALGVDPDQFRLNDPVHRSAAQTFRL